MLGIIAFPAVPLLRCLHMLPSRVGWTEMQTSVLCCPLVRGRALKIEIAVILLDSPPVSEPLTSNCHT